MSSIITTSGEHCYKPGDIIRIHVDNGFWKVFWYWLLQKDLKRYDEYEVSKVTKCSFTIET